MTILFYLLMDIRYISILSLQYEPETKIPLNWILAGALIVLLIGLIFEQLKKLFKKKRKNK